MGPGQGAGIASELGLAVDFEWHERDSKHKLMIVKNNSLALRRNRLHTAKYSLVVRESAGSEIINVQGAFEIQDNLLRQVVESLGRSLNLGKTIFNDTKRLTLDFVLTATLTKPTRYSNELRAKCSKSEAICEVEDSGNPKYAGTGSTLEAAIFSYLKHRLRGMADS
jgi:hypothetical protein